MDVEYTWIMTGGKLSLIKVAIFPRYYWSGRLSSMIEVGYIVTLAHYKVHFIIEHENLV